MFQRRRRGRPSEAEKMGLKIRIVELDETFDSYKSAAVRINGNPGGVYKCLSDVYPHEKHMGYHFEWYDEVDESDPFLW